MSETNNTALQVGLNRLALVAMYRQWMELEESERSGRVREVLAENDLDGALDTLVGIAAALDLGGVESAATDASEGILVGDHPELTGLYL